jgi:hypothetical protein
VLVTVVDCPSVSVARTLNVPVPVLDVLIGVPRATVPAHPATPALSTPPPAPGEHEKLAVTTCPFTNLAPFAGVTIVADGLPGVLVATFTVYVVVVVVC